MLQTEKTSYHNRKRFKVLNTGTESREKARHLPQ